jgi:hypothetical protein
MEALGSLGIDGLWIIATFVFLGMALYITRIRREAK